MAQKNTFMPICFALHLILLQNYRLKLNNQSVRWELSTYNLESDPFPRYFGNVHVLNCVMLPIAAFHCAARSASRRKRVKLSHEAWRIKRLLQRKAVAGFPSVSGGLTVLQKGIDLSAETSEPFD